jgi:hypothetical protein
MTPQPSPQCQVDIAYSLVFKAALEMKAIGVPEAAIRWGFAYGERVGNAADPIVADTFSRAVDDAFAGREPNPPYGRATPLDQARN